jgi:uncharacterized protein GlcG (DUF336 family)
MVLDFLNRNMADSPLKSPQYMHFTGFPHGAHDHVSGSAAPAAFTAARGAVCLPGARSYANETVVERPISRRIIVKLKTLAAAATVALLAVFLAMLSAASPAAAQASPPYGPPISLELAKRVMAAAEAVAEKNRWEVAITILDSGGNMVMMHKGDNTQLSGVSTSEGKAYTSLAFKRPSKALEYAVEARGAGLRLLTAKNVTPIDGGVLIMRESKIIGAIGVSGVLGAQNAEIAQTGADAVK